MDPSLLSEVFPMFQGDVSLVKQATGSCKQGQYRRVACLAGVLGVFPDPCLSAKCHKRNTVCCEIRT